MSALPSVGLVLDLYSGQGQVVAFGSATFFPDAVLTDVPAQAIVTQQPIEIAFSQYGFPSIELIPTDTPNLSPSGWAWNVTFNISGGPTGYSFLLPAGPVNFTATDASPAVFTFTPSSQLTTMPAGTAVELSGGSLPSGFTAATTYYVVNPSGATFQLSATSGGGAIASTSSGSGSVTVTQYQLSALQAAGSVTAVAPYMLNPMTAAGDIVTGGSSGVPQRLGVGSNGQVLTVSSGVPAWENASGGGGGGSVTSVSVASANGFTGTVANPGTTPAVTVETTVTGLLKGNGSAVSAAVANTDYAPPASPAFTGTPTAPTASPLTDSTQVATTAYTDGAVAAEAALLIPLTQKGAAGGVATLGAGSLVPQTQLAPVGSPAPSKYAGLLYGAVWGYAHQFWPDNYGAKGDGKIVTDAVMTSGSNVLACTSSAPFASGNPGKHALVSTAAGAYAPLHATIAGFTDSAHVTLSANATANTSGTPGAICYFGTDDLAALQAQMNAAAAYMAAHGYAEMLLDPSLIYILGGAFTVGSAGLGNNQLALPNIAQASQHGILALLGGADSAPLINWAQLVPEAPAAVLASVRTDGTNDATYGPAHIIGGPIDGYGGESGASTGWNNLHLVTRGISTLSPYNATFGGLDLFSVASCDVQSFSALTAAVVPGSSDAAPSMSNPANISNQWGWGLRLPSSGNNAAVRAGQVRCEGHCYGYGPSEHSVTQAGRLIYNITGIESYAGNGIAMTHSATIVKATVEGTINAVGYFDGAVHMDILCLDAESAGTIVYDPSNRGQGYIGLRNQGDAGAYRNDYKNGGSGIRIVNLLTEPGLVGSPPAVSTSATGNYYYRDATVIVSGGTVTGIAVDGTTLTGITSGPVRVPSGHSITLTYSATPSWQWVLD